MRHVTLARPLNRRLPVLNLPAVVAALALAVTATAQTNATPPAEDAKASAPELMPVVVSQEPSPKSPTISVSGMVRNESGEPLIGASVVLRADLGGSQYVFGVSHNRDVLARTTTNAEGRFSFEGIGVPPRLVESLNQLRKGAGGFHVVAWADGYALDWKTVASFDAPETGFELTRESDVSGIVVDEQGVPLEAGELKVTGFTKAVDNLDPTLKGPGDLNTILSELRFVGEIRKGRFVLHHMPQDYRISVRCESAAGHRAFFLIDTGNGTSTDFGYRNFSNARQPVYRAPIRATVKQNAWARIKVVDHEGNPVTDGGVMAVDSERHFGGSATVGEDGVATLVVNAPGLHEVHYAADPLHPRVGLIQPADLRIEGGETVEFRLPATRQVSGKVLDRETGEPIPGVYVLGGARREEEQMPRVTSTMAITDAEGRFELPTLEGEVSFWIFWAVDGYFVPDAYSVQGLPKVKRPTVMVKADEVPEEVVLHLAHGMTVQGQVFDQQGMPVAELKVTGQNEESPYRQATSVTDAEGRYLLTGLSPYVPTRLTVGSVSGAAEETIPPTKDHPWDETLTKNVDLKMTAGTAVAGRVVMRGRPVAGAMVSLHRGKEVEGGLRMELLSQVATDVEGKYRLGGLRKGDKYQLHVEPQGNAEVRDGALGRGHIETVGVQDGETIDLRDLELKTSGQTLAGVVVDRDGNPIAGFSVSASLASGMQLMRPQNGAHPWTETDKEGRFRLTDLPDEPIALMAYKAEPGQPILRPARANPEMNAQNIRIVYDPTLVQEPESLD